MSKLWNPRLAEIKDNAQMMVLMNNAFNWEKSSPYKFRSLFGLDIKQDIADNLDAAGLWNLRFFHFIIQKLNNPRCIPTHPSYLLVNPGSPNNPPVSDIVSIL